MADNVITDADRADLARQLQEAAEVLRATSKRVTAAKAPMTEAELGKRLWPAGFVKPTPKSSWR